MGVNIKARSVSFYWLAQVSRERRQMELPLYSPIACAILSAQREVLPGVGLREDLLRWPKIRRIENMRPGKNVNMSFLGLFLRPRGKELQPKYLF